MAKPNASNRCRPGESPVLKRTYLPSSLVPLSKRFRQMDQVGAVAGHKSHLDGSTRYQMYTRRWSIEPMFNEIKHSFGLINAWQQSRQTLARWTTLISLSHSLPRLLALWLGDKKEAQTFPYPLASAATRNRRLDRQSSATIFPTCQHQGLLGSKIPKIRAAKRGVYGYLQKSSIKSSMFDDFSSH